MTLVASVVLLGLSSSASAQPQFDFCAAATAVSRDGRSGAERLQLLRKATAEASEQLDQALWLFERVGPVAGAGARPFPLNVPGEGQRLKTTFFSLTVGYWLDVKTDLCRCLPEGEQTAGACARLPQEVARACTLEPPRPGIDIRCLTKGR